MSLHDLDIAHQHSIRHRAEVLESEICGCFYCLSTYPPSAIVSWTDWPQDTLEAEHNEKGQTALCPSCDIDSVLGSASGFPITTEFLQKMHDRWFK
jgi:hypothetical protein